jgi:5S rRNA maturation endonuclease (ribonuclease M5)
MIFVFCALLEFAVVNSYMRKANKYEKLSKALEKRQVSLESDPDEDDEGPYIPTSLNKHSYHLVGNLLPKKKEDKKVSSTNSSIPLSTFSVYRKKIALSRSSSSLNNQPSQQDPESHPCSVYATTTANDSFHGRIATLATIDMEDSMTLSAENIPLNGSKPQPAAKLQSSNFRQTDESPTKTTFISDEEWPEQVIFIFQHKNTNLIF